MRLARAFAAEEAKLFLTGHVLAPVKALATELGADAAEVDATDEQAIDEHLSYVIDKAGRLDTSFNAMGIADHEVCGVPLVELDLARFSLPITAYTTSYFLTAQLAARRMLPNKSGVIMTVSALPGRTGTALNGGYGAASRPRRTHARSLRRARPARH